MTLIRKNILVFDLDGTLVDSMGAFAHSAGQIMSQLYSCTYEWGKEQYQATSGIPFPDQLQKIFPKNPLNTHANDLFIQEKTKSYHRSCMFDGAHQSLVELRNQGFHLIISSNNDQILVTKKMAEYQDLFIEILGHQHNIYKGEDHFRTIEDSLNCSRKQFIFIGDSLHDALIAQECGVSFIAKCGTFPKASFLTQGIAEDTFDHYKNFVQTVMHVSSREGSDISNQVSLPNYIY